MNISIREAVESDMAAVHLLVQQLADFEKAGDQVQTSPEIYRTDAFDEHKFHILVAEKASEVLSGKLVGAALYFEAYSSWKGPFLWLDDLIVEEKYRGQGIGTSLLEALNKKAVSKNMALIKWQVIDWNRKAIELYDKLGAVAEPQWITYRWDL